MNSLNLVNNIKKATNRIVRLVDLKNKINPFRLSENWDMIPFYVVQNSGVSIYELINEYVQNENKQQSQALKRKNNGCPLSHDPEFPLKDPIVLESVTINGPIGVAHFSGLPFSNGKIPFVLEDHLNNWWYDILHISFSRPLAVA